MIEDEFGMSRDELMRELKKKGIETRTFFIPMHEQPVFLNRGFCRGAIKKRFIFAFEFGVERGRDKVYFRCDKSAVGYPVEDKT